MAKHTVVVLLDNEEYYKEMERIFSDLDKFEIVGYSGDGREGIEIVKRTRPEILILDLILKTCDGFAVMDKLASEGIDVKTVVISSFSREEIISKAIARGALYYMVKPVPSGLLKSRLIELVDLMPAAAKVKESTDYYPVSKSSLDEKISKIFISVGIPPHIKGYSYLREGVKLAVKQPDIINSITKKLYPMIGEKYSTSASKVERAIRHAIEVAWNKGRIDSINNIFGVRAYIGSEKPTNGEFIALIADKMLLDGA